MKFLDNLTLRWYLDTDETKHVCICVCVSFSLFFCALRNAFQLKSSLSVGPVHCLRDPQTSLFSNFFIKNWFHDTIHTFKNYFVTVFSVFSKISDIQTDPKPTFGLH